MWFCNVGLYPDKGDLLFFFFSFGGQSRKSFCIFLFVICRQKGALKKIFSLAADFHLWKSLCPNLTLWQKLCTHFAKQIWNLWSCPFLDRAVICQCVCICSFLSICNFLDDSANFLCTFCARQRERERERDFLIATLDPDKMSNILHRANTQTIYFVLDFKKCQNLSPFRYICTSRDILQLLFVVCEIETVISWLHPSTQTRALSPDTWRGNGKSPPLLT